MSYVQNILNTNSILSSTAYDRKYVCIAISGDFNIILPKVKDSYSGSFIKFVVSSNSINTITINASVGDVIDDNLISLSISADQIVYLQNIGNNKWSTLNTEGTGVMYANAVGNKNSLSYYTNLKAMPEKIGGIEAGTSFNQVPMTQVLDSLLYPYQVPYFSNFSFVQDSPVEVGQPVSGIKDFTWNIVNSDNLITNSIKIDDFSNTVNLANNLDNDSIETLDIGTIVNNSDSSHTWRITGFSTKNVEFVKDFTVAWRWKIYYGISFDNTFSSDIQIKALSNSELAASRLGVFSFGVSGYKYICYPISFGAITSFKDVKTNLDVPFEMISGINVTNDYGASTTYYVYRTINQLGSSIDILVG